VRVAILVMVVIVMMVMIVIAAIGDHDATAESAAKRDCQNYQCQNFFHDVVPFACDPNSTERRHFRCVCV
jgi:hypothetical protein